MSLTKIVRIKYYKEEKSVKSHDQQYPEEKQHINGDDGM